MRYSITGISDELTYRQYTFVAKIIKQLTDVDELTTGAAYGVDSVAYYSGVMQHPNIVHRVCYPHGLWFNEKLLADAKQWGHVVEKYRSYMLRNDGLIKYADTLIAFPRSAIEERRSGTWATVRRARKAGIPVEIHALDTCS